MRGVTERVKTTYFVTFVSNIMSFNRLSYDSCSYKQDLAENVSYLGYMLDPSRYEHCSKCRPEHGIVGGTAVSHARGNLVDLENNLFGIDRPNTRCASFKHIPSDEPVVQGKEYIKPVCHPAVDTRPVHLKPCQFFDVHAVPRAPEPQPFRCSSK